MRKYLLFVVLVLCTFRGTQAADPLKDFLALPGLKGASVGILMVNSNTGDTLLMHDNEKSLMPASTMKLLTTSTALEMLQPNFKFGTKVYASAPPSGNGTLYGKLIIKASGDPTFGSTYFNITPEMVFDVIFKTLEQHNITHIDGGIEINTSIFDEQVIPPGWIWEDMGNYYAPGTYGLAWRDNMYSIYLKSEKPGTPVKVLRTDPEMEDLHLTSYVTAGNHNKDSAYVYSAPYASEAYISGSIPAFREEFKIKASLSDPAELFMKELELYLHKKGVEVKGGTHVNNHELPQNAQLMKALYSPFLHDIVSITNKQSVNLYAEYLLKHLSLRTSQSANREKSIKMVYDYWRKRHFDIKYITVADGSGLSPKNRLTPDFMVALLDYMRTKSRYNESFLTSLPISGKDGTLKSFLENTSLQGRVYAKTGSMTGVRCYAGYIHAPNDDIYTFSIMVNQFTGETQHIVHGIEQLLLQTVVPENE